MSRPVPAEERARLARTFGVLLRAERERARLTQVELAERAGLSERAVQSLGEGRARPSTTSVWRLARALRPREDWSLHDTVALDERLRRAAGPSLRVNATRPHRRREAVRAELVAAAEATGGEPATGADEMGSLILAELIRGSEEEV